MTRRALATTLSAALVLAGAVTAAAAPGDSDAPPPAAVDLDLPAEETALVRLQLPNRQTLEQLVADGADLAGVPATSPDVRGDRVLADLVVTGAELAALQADGATIVYDAPGIYVDEHHEEPLTDSAETPHDNRR